MRKKTVVMDFRLPEKDYEALKDYANRHEMSMSDVLRTALKVTLASELVGENETNIIVI